MKGVPQGRYTKEFREEEEVDIEAGKIIATIESL